MNSSKNGYKKAILGIGLDNDDGHKRITQAEQFAVIGGSEATHEAISETLIKTMEELNRKSKALEHIGSKELAELIDKHKSD